ncbi:hypothetical protein LTR97_002779 [Elasticomyces elasticus]|uniref:Uncharacterized protein n=1 Tax=Elasticomyces elasticus TaxID=574655 RepID=A0AAN7ZPP2_9PEZI|nr:hypothetical protein LTR97_002779 [Elasticomyces elasticus]
MAKPAHARNETTLLAPETLNIKDRVEQTLAAAIVLALKAAVTSNPAPEPPRRRFRSAVSRGFRTLAGRLRHITPWSEGPTDDEQTIPTLPCDSDRVGTVPTLASIPVRAVANPPPGDLVIRPSVTVERDLPVTTLPNLHEPIQTIAQVLASHGEASTSAVDDDILRVPATSAAGTSTARPPQEHLNRFASPPQNDRVVPSPSISIPVVAALVTSLTTVSDALRVPPTSSDGILRPSPTVDVPTTIAETDIPLTTTTLADPRAIAIPLQRLSGQCLFPDPRQKALTIRLSRNPHTSHRDVRRVRRSASDVMHLPDRIKFRVALYTEMTRKIELWLIKNAERHQCSTYSTMVWRVRDDDGSVVIKIKPPIENYMALAEYLTGKVLITPTVVHNIGYLIWVRAFVSAWYTSVQDAEPLLPIDCVVRRKTDTHVHFTDMLRRLHTVLRNAQA